MTPALGNNLLLTVVCLLFASFTQGSNHDGQQRRRRKPLEKQVPTSDRRDHDSSDKNPPRLDIRNMTCDYFEQSLNHFALPRRTDLTYRQRYCVYNGYVANLNNATVLFYTGNESPLEQYINNTGLMWELAPLLQAQMVFVEHRYEGESLPDPSIPNCMAYSSSIQALADYANFIEKRLFGGGDDSSTANDGLLQRRPVIAFGGSYGGMLSAWMRMKYPNVIAGAVAASAPIWGFPRNFPTKIDSAWQVIHRGLQRPYPPTRESHPGGDDENEYENHCAANLLASWPLIQLLASTEAGRDLLTRAFRLCSPLTKAEHGDLLIGWAQSPWFDLAEGSFPYPSSYIPFALTHDENAKLPAWPLQSACWKNSSLHQDFGIRFRGNLSDVRYQIIFDASTKTLFSVDWDNATATRETLDRLAVSDAVADLLTSVRDAVSVWFNVTLDAPCYNLTAAPNKQVSYPTDQQKNYDASSESSLSLLQALRNPLSASDNVERHLLLKHDAIRDDNSIQACLSKMKEGSWPALCCNEEMYLIITEASGLGHDAMWPPSHPRGTSTLADIINSSSSNALDPVCQDPKGFFGYPQDMPDPWATWYDEYYGGTRIEAHSNIIFSNGLLDPWSAAGVYAKGMDPTSPRIFQRPSKRIQGDEIVPGLYLQNITETGTVVAVIMDFGGHHTDLMYSYFYDPPSITAARDLEVRFVKKWIKEWWET